MDKEFNNMIQKNKLYKVIEFFYTIDRSLIENFYLHNAQVNEIVSGNTYLFTLQTLYTIYEGFGKETENEVPEDYRKLFSIEASLILAYDKKNKNILNELYNMASDVIKYEEDNYKFLELVKDKESYNKYKKITYPNMEFILKSRG